MDIRSKQRAVVHALEDVKGHDIVVYNVAALSPIFERVVIASGESGRQLRALADRVQEALKALGAKVYGVEGEAGAEWVLVDLGDVVVHIMHPAARSYYNLEEIWGGKPVRVKSSIPIVRTHAGSSGRARRIPGAGKRRTRQR